MRHRLSRLRLRQKPAHSWSMQRNIVTSLFLYETVRTTKKRAEVVRPLVDKLITVVKTRPAHVAIRHINRYVTHVNASKKAMEVLKSRYATRTSGFTRMIALGSRQGDGAELVNLELVDRDMSLVTSTATDKPKAARPAGSGQAKPAAPKKAKAVPSKPATPVA